jgi:predicted N-acyltransferase
MSPDATHAIVLDAGFDAVEKRWKKNNSAHLRNVRKARRAEIEVARTVETGDFGEYFDVYQSTLERWGGRASSAYRRDLFEAIRERLDDDIALWVARDGRKIVAGALCFYARRHAVYWHGAALASHFDRRPVNLLMYEIARDACGRGMSWFDLNPSGGQEGVERFKRSLGAEPFPSPVVTTSTALARVARWVRGKR